MDIPQNIWLLIFVGDFVVVSLLACYAFISYYHKLGELKKAQAQSYQSASDIMAEAEKKTAAILEKVEQKSQEILTHSELFKNDLNAQFKNAFADSAQKFVASYEGLLTSVKNESLAKTTQSLTLISDEIKKNIEESRTTLKAEVMKSLSKTTQEIEKYKQDELLRVDQEIDAVVVQIAKEVLRTSITPKDHKKLVMQALDKAKEQGMFFL